MDVKYDSFPEEGAQIVYIRPVQVADLPEQIRAQAEGLETIWAVHRPDGERVALVRDRGMAFALARQNDLAPVSSH